MTPLVGQQDGHKRPPVVHVGSCFEASGPAWCNCKRMERQVNKSARMYVYFHGYHFCGIAGGVVVWCRQAAPR